MGARLHSPSSIGFSLGERYDPKTVVLVDCYSICSEISNGDVVLTTNSP